MTGSLALAVETGGTKIIAWLADDDRIFAESHWPTTPEAARDSILEWAISVAPRGGAVIQSVTDEEAFRVSDVENRSRKDISDWERAKEIQSRSQSSTKARSRRWPSIWTSPSHG